MLGCCSAVLGDEVLRCRAVVPSCHSSFRAAAPLRHLVEALHTHPEIERTTPRGPTVVFEVLFPRTGSYRLWTQFQRRGTVITLPFTVQVEPRA